MRTISVGSVCLSSCSQLSPYYPSFFGSLSLSGELVIVLSTPGPRLLFPAPAPPLLHLPTPLKTKLSHGPASEPLCAHSRCIHLLHPTPEHAGRHPGRGRKSLVTTQTTEDSVASVQDRPRQLGSPLSTGTEPGGAGSFLRLTPGSR